MNPSISVADFSRLREPIVIDVRWTLGGASRHPDYLSAHIPNAYFLELDTDITGEPGSVGGRHPLPDVNQLQTTLRDVGVNNDSTIVIYDDGAPLAAARTWWTLRWAGLTEVTVLEGGFAAWCEAGRGVESGSTALPEPGGVTLDPGRLPLLEADDIPEWVESHNLVDVRTPERYRGDEEPIDPVAGHIPGAINIPMTDADSVADIEDAAFYCGSGVTAAMAAWTQASHGKDVPPIYVGSWSDWISHERDVAVGEA
ncbi:sulfurtransferase [Haloglycomyces albus]|uniref:sulfurtransferase n=1 Tax=Haloglycomyces albus TaxID=526067 RepID=UPI00046CC6E4|nr:rhodanese-like domain-containing protein [Haloglycomyces albus]